MTEPNKNTPFKIGHCLITPSDFSVLCDSGEKKALQPKFIEVLCYLAQHYPRIVPRDELIDKIWGEHSYVGEKSLTNAIWHLRQKLADINNNQEVIETIRKAGYRLLIQPQWQTNSSDNVVNHVEKKSRLKTDISTSTLLLAFIGICFFFVIGFSYFANDKQTIPTIISQITKQPGSELFPAPSPDGRYLVYKKFSPDSSTNLFMQDRQHLDQPAKQLTFDQAIEGHSVWSNDSMYLYFARKDDSQNTCHYIQLNVVTQQEKIIVNCPMYRGYFYLDISADDSILAFHGYSEPADESGIYFIELNKQNAKPYRFSCSNNCGYTDRDMAFSPDGKSIAVTRRTNRFNEDIYLIDLASKATKQLTFDQEDIVGLTWHPDGEQIVYATQHTDVRRGFILDINTKITTPLGISGFSYPSYAKKNNLLFFHQRKENYSIASLQLNDDIISSPFPVVQSEFNHHYPDYNKFNQSFVYVSNESGFYELWTADTNGNNRQQLTNLKQSVRYPKWSHDGTKITFLSPFTGDTSDAIYIYSLLDKSLSLLNSPFKQHHRPTWSFDDTSIISAIYDNEFTDLFSINIKDGSSKRLTFDNARYGIMTSPTTLLYTKRKRGLWQLELGMNTKPLNIINGEEFNTLYVWNYQTSGIFFHKGFSDHHQIKFYNFSDRTITPLVRLPLYSFDNYDSFTYVANKDKLLFTSSSFPQADIKMMTNKN